jgi:hypothetical protein
MIIADDCSLDKEKNEFMRRLIRDGVPQDEARARAVADTSLDILIPVAPIFQYSSLRFASEGGIRTAQTVGYFPVVEKSSVMYEGYVDLSRTVSVSRNLLAGRLASLSESARNVLRWKLAQTYAARNLSVESKLTEAIGKTITNVVAIRESKKREVARIELDQGESAIVVKLEPDR